MNLSDEKSLSDQATGLQWERIVDGDTSAFAGLVDKYKNLVSSIAYSMTGDLAGSEDIAQETFLVAWQSRNELSDQVKLAGWLSSITRNLSRQWVRKRTSKSWPSTNLDATDISRAESHPVERLVSDEEQQLVWSTLESIPENYREVLVLYYRESHSIAEVAQTLEISEESARQRLARGRNMLRAEVERTVEAALTKSRLSSSFTTGVLSAIVVGTGSSIGKAATTATAGVLGKTTAHGALLATSQTAASGAALGMAGALVGILGGLGGTWLSIRVPQLMAPTMTERKLLEEEGRITWRMAVILMVILMSLCLLILLRPNANSAMLVSGVSVFLSISFAVTCVVRGIRLNRRIREIRESIRPEDDPNPTWLKDRVGITHARGRARWIGRRRTSRLKLLGWPLYDFQVSDPVASSTHSQALHANGWLAVGDRATGLIAIGGLAKGVIALGGMAVGLVSMGGLSVGVISMGGLAVGGLAIGGMAIGHSAIGGGAAGWQAVGGGALGIYSANGGLAVAGTIAEGGGAISLKYAVGGGAHAPEANTAAARKACRESWVADYLSVEMITKDPAGFRQKTLIYSTILPIGISVLMAIGVPLLLYRRSDQA